MDGAPGGGVLNLENLGLYSYMLNNPVNLMDPEGRQTQGGHRNFPPGGAGMGGCRNQPAKPPQSANAGNTTGKQPAAATGAARKAANAAQAARPRPTTAAALETNKGTFTGVSGSPQPLHPKVQKELDAIPQSQRSPSMVVALSHSASRGLLRQASTRLGVR